MNLQLKARIKNGQLELCEALPSGVPDGDIVVILQEETQPFSEGAPLASGFIRDVLLHPSEDVWEND